MAENQFGKVSSLELTAEERRGETILKEVRFTAPYKIMQPFRKRDGGIQVMLLAASAGILEGDRQKFQIKVKPGAKLEFLSQSYDKIHPMAAGSARRDILIQVASHASLAYHPQPTIPFRDSAFESRMRVELEDETSVFQLSEILSCGRAARGERFAYRYYRNYVEIYRAGRLIYRDNTRYEPDWFEMEGMGMFESYTHLANLFFTEPKEPDSFRKKVRELLEEDRKTEGGITRASGGFAVRIFGRRAQDLERLSQKICGLLSTSDRRE